MTIISKKVLCLLLSFMCLFTCIGYAAVVDSMSVSGLAEVGPSHPELYITKVTPNSSAGVTVMSTYGTIMFSEVDSSGTASFTIEVKNESDKIYVFERVLLGPDMGYDDAYNGDDITYQISNIKMLDEVAPNGGTRTFNVTITVPRGVTTDNYILIYKFVEKTGTEILPGNDEYDITFKYNNGQPDMIVKAHVNELIPRPETPVRNGHTFIGWYKDVSYTEPWNFDIDTVQGNMILYAGWQAHVPDQYIVTFRPNNGEADRTLQVPANSLIPIQDIPVREGYTFIGWYTDREWTTPWNFDTDKVDRHMVLYGGWEIYVPPVPPERNITFKPNNGEPDYTIIVMTGDFIPRPTVPTREGYTFIGWYTDAECTQPWNFEVNKVEGDTVLYGGWELNVIETVEYTVTFQPNNGSAVTSVTVEEGKLIPRPDTPVREGYVFMGWYTDEALTSGWNFDIDTVASDMTLYGNWKKEEVEDPNDKYHSDFMGLVEALLSDSNNCLNDNDLIFDAVMESLTSKKRPEEDAPILHCSVNSVSGGTMSAIATYANAKLTSNIHFIFEVDPDPAYQNKRMRLYMYYGDEIEAATTGENIMVYLQIVTRGDDGVWYADGTYVGEAPVGNYFGGGNAGKDVKTIDPYSWVYTSSEINDDNIIGGSGSGRN